MAELLCPRSSHIFDVRVYPSPSVHPSNASQDLLTWSGLSTALVPCHHYTSVVHHVPAVRGARGRKQNKTRALLIVRSCFHSFRTKSRPVGTSFLWVPTERWAEHRFPSLSRNPGGGWAGLPSSDITTVSLTAQAGLVNGAYPPPFASHAYPASAQVLALLRRWPIFKEEVGWAVDPNVNTGHLLVDVCYYLRILKGPSGLIRTHGILYPTDLPARSNKKEKQNEPLHHLIHDPQF